MLDNKASERDTISPKCLFNGYIGDDTEAIKAHFYTTGFILKRVNKAL